MTVKPQETGLVITEAPPSSDPLTRGQGGRFAPGNKGGGRRRMPDEIREMLAAASPHAAKRLIEALDAEKVVHYLGQEVGSYIDHDMRTKAALALMERLYGKTPQAIVTEDEDGNSRPMGVIFLPVRPPSEP